MTSNPNAEKRVNSYCDFAAVLRGHTRATLDDRHDKAQALMERQLDLKRARATLRGDAEIAAIEADCTVLAKRVADLNEIVSVLSKESACARTLAERLLVHTGLRHADFSPGNDAALKGYRI